MHRKWFQRLLLSYLPILFVVSLSLLLMTYLTLSEISKKSALRANEMLSRDIMQSLEVSLRGIDTMLNKAITDNGPIKRLFEPLPADQRQYADYQAAVALSDLAAGNPLIHSLYVYRLEDNMIITPSTSVGLADFGDREFIGQQVTNFYPFKWTGRREYRKETGDRPADVVSLVKFAKLSNRSLIVVNVDTASLNRHMRVMSSLSLHFLDLVDQEGSLVASRDLADGTNAGTPHPSGRQWSSVRSDYTQWSLRSGVYQASIAEWVSSLFYLWIAIGFLVVALCIVWLVYATRRNYKPIRNFADKVADYSVQQRDPPAHTDKLDEFQYIETVFEQLLDRSSLLQEQNKENLDYRKLHVFLNLLEGSASSRKDGWVSELKQLGFQGTYPGFLAVVVEIDRYADFVARYNSRDQYVLKQALRTVVMEISESSPFPVWPEWVSRHQLAVLYFYQDAVDSEQDEKVIQLCEELRTWVEQNLAFTVTVGIGNRISHIEDTSETYKNALQALHYKSSLGMNRLIMPSDLTSKPQGEIFMQLHIIRTICQSFRTGDSDWEGRFHELCNTLDSCMFSHEDLLNLLNYLVYHLHKEMLELPEEQRGIWESDAHPALQLILEREETAAEIYAEFFRVLLEASVQIRGLRESKNSYHLIRNVKQYIGDNFMNPDLSLSHLSDEFGLNASHLSRLFKEAFGVNFVDSLTRIRIDKAEELLQNTGKAVQDVAIAVGYTNARTFIRVFKKLKGSTPGSFRNEDI
ncbi:helix-turn-helix domain-containing protein [Paenibacillus hodogayensis]|uniref:Helix-turn-helix domain-containing protein n=1 Tax=Paenibacillus hodogayensis TaxID=279208 RepID=A0ABV5VWU9_9BACL